MAQVYDSLLWAPVVNFIDNPCENEHQCLESLAELLRGNRTELYFASKFSKTAVLIEENRAFSRTFENIELENTKQYRRSKHKERMRHNYQAKIL